MSHFIYANLEDGSQVKIGIASAGSKPKFFPSKKYNGGRLDSNAMFKWLESNADTVIIGSYGLTDQMYDYVTPLQFKAWITSNEVVRLPSWKEVGLKPIIRHYGGKHKSVYAFNEGVYTDRNLVDWTFRSSDYFG